MGYSHEEISSVQINFGKYNPIADILIVTHWIFLLQL